MKHHGRTDLLRFGSKKRFWITVQEWEDLFSASALLSQTTNKAVQIWRVSVPVISSRETFLLLLLFLSTEICSFAGQELCEICLAQLEPLITAVKEANKNNICAHQQRPIGFSQHYHSAAFDTDISQISSSSEHPIIRGGEEPSTISDTSYCFSPPFSQRQHGHQGVF